MKRREFIALVGAAATWPFETRAQEKGPLIGYLTTGALGSTPQSPAPALDAFRQGLREQGYVEGENIQVEVRSAKGDIGQLPTLAMELVRLNVQVIVAVATPAARAARLATTTIPIVAANMGDPVSDGLIVSLAWPGGNVTGSTFLGPELVPKRLELLKEALPKATRVAVLSHPTAFGEDTMREMLAQTHAAAQTQGLEIQLLEVNGAADFERAFSSIIRADALLVYPSVMLFVERERISRLAAKHRLPTISVGREFVQLGGLIAYGPSISEPLRRAAGYVHRILNGAKPAELPVEQPTKFELVINLKTAKALGLTIPPTLLARADEVIE